jgi:hypothetical protein
MNTSAGQVKLSLYQYGNACIHGATADHRFHMWLDPETLLPIDGVIYKNPQQSDRNTRTIKLDMRRGSGKQIADAMLPQAHALRAEAKAELAAELARKEAEAAAARAKRITEEAGPELLEALKLAVAAMRAPIDEWKGEVERKALDAARAAIAKATAQ